MDIHNHLLNSHIPLFKDGTKLKDNRILTDPTLCCILDEIAYERDLNGSYQSSIVL